MSSLKDPRKPKFFPKAVVIKYFNLPWNARVLLYRPHLFTSITFKCLYQSSLYVYVLYLCPGVVITVLLTISLKSGVFVEGLASQSAHHWLRAAVSGTWQVLERHPWKHTPTISGENKIVTRLSGSCHCTEICYFHKTQESQSCKNMKDEIVIRNRNLFFTSTQNHGKTSPPIHALNCLQSSGADEILYFCIRLGRGNFRLGSCRHLLSLNVVPQRIWKERQDFNPSWKWRGWTTVRSLRSGTATWLWSSY